MEQQSRLLANSARNSESRAPRPQNQGTRALLAHEMRTARGMLPSGWYGASVFLSPFSVAALYAQVFLYGIQYNGYLKDTRTRVHFIIGHCRRQKEKRSDFRGIFLIYLKATSLHAPLLAAGEGGRRIKGEQACLLYASSDYSVKGGGV